MSQSWEKGLQIDGRTGRTEFIGPSGRAGGPIKWRSIVTAAVLHFIEDENRKKNRKKLQKQKLQRQNNLETASGIISIYYDTKFQTLWTYLCIFTIRLVFVKVKYWRIDIILSSNRMDDKPLDFVNKKPICTQKYESRYSRMDQVSFFNNSLPQILLCPFLNTLTHMTACLLFCPASTRSSYFKYFS